MKIIIIIIQLLNIICSTNYFFFLFSFVCCVFMRYTNKSCKSKSKSKSLINYSCHAYTEGLIVDVSSSATENDFLPSCGRKSLQISGYSWKRLLIRPLCIAIVSLFTIIAVIKIGDVTKNSVCLRLVSRTSPATEITIFSLLPHSTLLRILV